jgi:hypothetical protein
MLLIPGTVRPASAQTEPPEDARVLFDSLALVPVLRLTEVGWDDNVLHVNESANPAADITATFSPDILAWYRAPGLRISGRTRTDFVYFKDLSEFRSIDTDNSGRLEVPLGRLTPYVGGASLNARHRRNFEIDVPVRRVEWSWNTGVDVRVTGKTSFGVMARGSHADYKGQTVYLDSDLAYYLGATAKGVGGRFRWAVTPFTTIGFEAERYENRLAKAPERNSDGNQVAATFEFSPRAQLTGSARVGVTNRKFIDGRFPPFQGIVSRVDLAYTLLGRTRFGVGVQRDLSYSYRADLRDYLETSVRLSVTQRIASGWDLGGTVGRFRLSYGLGEPIGGVVPDDAAETGVGYSVDLGYQIRRARLGFQVARQTRTSDFSVGRDYEETRVTSSIAYRF